MSFQGASVALAVFSTLIWTIFFILTSATYALDQRIYTLENGKLLEGQEPPVSATYTDQECKEFRASAQPALQVCRLGPEAPPLASYFTC